MSDNGDCGVTGETCNVNACVVCYKDVEIYSIGLCEHPVCYECSTRMRVLCRQNECPICRQDLPKVVFTRIVKPFRHLRRSNLLDTRYSVYFDSPDIQERFNTLLAHICPICDDKQSFGNFNGLKDHMRRRHELHYCDLCVDNLKIFSHERRCYTRSNLSQHRRKGDHDDKSHKGHPLCEFCDQRYMDNDELFRHLRRDHLYCHFCDADGYHHYYNSHQDLRDHFRREHYLCEEGTCMEEMFTGVFRTDIDLKAHKACTHGKHLGKAAAKQARTLELEFTLAPRGENRNNRRIPVGGTSGAGGNSAASGQTNSRRNRDCNNRDYREQHQQQNAFGSRDHQADTADSFGFAQTPFDVESAAFARQPDVRSTEEFPSLGNTASPVIPNIGQSRGRGNLTIRGSSKPQGLAVTDENFPALGPDSAITTMSGVSSASGTTAVASSGISKTLNLSVSSGNKKDTSGALSQRPKSAAAANVSIRVNHKTDGTVTTRVSGPNIRIRPTQRASMDCDFPALGRSNPPADGTSSSSNTAQWTKVTCVKRPPEQSAKIKQAAPSPFAEIPPRLPSSDDFPSLSKPSGSKKQLSIAVVPRQSSWPQQQRKQQQQQQKQTKNPDNETKSIADATKGKTKKKKVKQQTNGNNSSSSNESTGSKLNNNVTINTKAKGQMEENYGEEMDPRRKKETDKRCNKDRKKICTNDDTTEADASVGMDKDKNAQVTLPRKRSELKIDGLKTNDNVYSINEDFPSLAVAKSVSSTSNGKSTKKLTNPPPGFGSATPPPPGFAVKISQDDRTTGFKDNSLTFTNSSGESYTILPTKTEANKIYTYTPPLDFQRRNKNLVAGVSQVLGDQDAIQEFRHLSGSFRQGDCTAQDYYKRCRRAMGDSAFENIFPEILALLPDIEKQSQLFKIHQRETNDRTKRSLEACGVCGQILKIGNDREAHLSSHTMENHFPVLGDTSNNTLLPSATTWVVRKV